MCECVVEPTGAVFANCKQHTRHAAVMVHITNLRQHRMSLEHTTLQKLYTILIKKAMPEK